MNSKTALNYILLTVAFTFLSSGVLVAGFLDSFPSVGYSLLWLLLPMTALFILAVLTNDRLLIPRLLLNGRYMKYVLAVLTLVYGCTLCSLALEYATRRCLDMPLRIKDYMSPWLLADTLGNSLLLGMILLGLALLHIFNRWRKEQESERSVTEQLEEYIRTVNRRLNPAKILARLSALATRHDCTPEELETGIRELTDFLRTQLYELPAPPAVKAEDSTRLFHDRIAGFLAGKRFRLMRHIVFLTLLGIISCGAFFVTPDNPEFSLHRLSGVLSMFALMAVLSYINILWLYPRFLKRGSLRRYTVAIGVLLAVLVLPIILIQVLTYDSNVYDKGLPLLIAFISTVGTVITLFLFIGGISAVLVLQNWINTGWRMSLLRAETVRQEYHYLRKQINPHFLFNVLNNIAQTAYEDSALAFRLLQDLRSLLRYQLGNARRDTTTLAEELDFIRSYFALEGTRREQFSYLLDAVDVPQDIVIPTLLFIPFVENAVKYSYPQVEVPDVEIHFRLDSQRLTFCCSNPYNPEKVRNIKRGGIGIDNTMRRLGFLYGEDFHFHATCEENIYSIQLNIPVRNELHNS